VQLGSRPISFSLFVHDQSLCVFASCDRPTVIFSRSRHNAKLLFSPVNISTDVSQMTPFHTQCFPHCLAMSSESALQIGTIDSLQTIHVQSYHLNESPRHICFHEQSATYVVCSTKTEMTARGESAQDRILFLDNKEYTTRCVFELDPNEAAMSCQSIVFDTPTSVSESSDDKCSIEYVVIGTAYVLPEEQQPTRGRMLVFEVHTPASVISEVDPEEDEEDSAHLKRNVSLIAESVTKGAVFSMANLQGKLVAGVDCQILVYQFYPKGIDGAGAPELVVLCQHVGHIMSLFCKTSGDVVLVGDILRSITVLQLKKTTGAAGTEVTSLKEISRDFNSNYMRAVEVLNDDYFMGAEDNGNLFILKRPGAEGVTGGPSNINLTEEEKSRLEMQSAFHMGDFINVFRKGTLGTNNSSANVEVPEKDLKGVSTGSGDSSGAIATPLALFGTVSGCVGAVLTLSSEMYHFLDVLEKSLNHVIRGLGGLSHDEYRQFAHSRRRGHKRCTIDGDLVEMFLDLPEAQMRLVTKHLNDELHHLAVTSSQEAKNSPKKAENDKKPITATSYTLDEVIHRLEELVRLH
jgi:DNA damage-binding protein 1